MEKFVLIDGNAILHRAYHALPPLTSKSGQVVNAVYGFFSMYLKIIQDLRPQYLAVCFDRAAPTFRQSLYVGYQAKRPKMADDLVPQMDIVHDVLQKARISIFEVDGYEADDLIGTLARQALSNQKTQNTQKISKSEKSEHQKVRSSDSLTFRRSEFSEFSGNIEVIIVSGDRDMLQLVNSHVKVLAPVVGITNMVLYDAKKVEEKYGIKPSQIVDYKALAGDSSDNYPGVPGVGPKTAANLLKEYGNLENIYKNLGSIKKKNEKLATRLAEGTESAGLAQKLAGIVKDAPIKLKLDECLCSDFDMKGLKEEFGKFGFKSLIKRLTSDASKETKEPKETEEKKDKVEQMGLL